MTSEFDERTCIIHALSDKDKSCKSKTMTPTTQSVLIFDINNCINYESISSIPKAYTDNRMRYIFAQEIIHLSSSITTTSRTNINENNKKKDKILQEFTCPICKIFNDGQGESKSILFIRKLINLLVC
jgi:hypothetical protein